MSRAIAQLVSRWPVFESRARYVGFAVDEVALWKISSEYFGFPCQILFHQMLHIYLSCRASTSTNVQSGLSLTQPCSWEVDSRSSSENMSIAPPLYNTAFNRPTIWIVSYYKNPVQILIFCVSKIHFNIILSFTLSYDKWPLLFSLLTKVLHAVLTPIYMLHVTPIQSSFN
jgi:hypothetical protein